MSFVFSGFPWLSILIVRNWKTFSIHHFIFARMLFYGLWSWSPCCMSFVFSGFPRLWAAELEPRQITSSFAKYKKWHWKSVFKYWHIRWISRTLVIVCKYWIVHLIGKCQILSGISVTNLIKTHWICHLYDICIPIVKYTYSTSWVIVLCKSPGVYL